MATHSVGHSEDAAKNRGGTVLLQSVTLTFRTGGDVGSSAESMQIIKERVATRWEILVDLGSATW